MFVGELFPASERNPFLGASGEDQDRCLLAAARAIDELAPWLEGTRVDEVQALEFPRDGIYQKDGVTLYLATVMPSPVKRAQSILAAYIAKNTTGNPFGPAKHAGLSSVAFGSELSMSFESGASSTPTGQRVMAQIVMPILGSALVRTRQPRVVRG